MLEPRVIPCLLLSQEGLVKTVRFKRPHYVGDPVNVMSIFNEFEVDELVLLDIFATVEGRPPAFELLERVANECMIPLAYGGGIRSVEDAARIFKIGVEKVIFNTGLLTHPEVIQAIIDRFGAQSVLASIDAKPGGFFNKGYQAYVTRGKRRLGANVVEAAKAAEALGVGEIMLQAIDRDGTFEGFDLELIRQVSGAVSIPVLAGGGASKRADLAGPVLEGGASGVVAGSLFVYQSAERGVLVNFPDRQEIRKLLKLE
jgi:cyclase